MSLLANQIDETERRWHADAEVRANRLRTLAASPETRDLSGVDELERVVRRLTTMGRMDAAASLARKGMAPLVAGVRTPPDMTLLERILGARDLLRSSFLEDGAQIAKSVGRIVTRSSGFGFGTGFMVSPRLLMTNNHVLRSVGDVERSAVQFDFVEDAGGNIGRTPRFLFEPQVFFLTHAALDYTLVAVQEANDAGDAVGMRGWNPLHRDSGSALVTEPVNIIQHPGGDPQQVALRENNILSIVGPFLHYRADTERGSSGSPVLNDQWELAALHHSGVPDRDSQGRILLVSGQPWDGSDRAAGQIRWVANEGVRISEIMADLDRRRAGLSDPQQALLSETTLPRPEPGEALQAADRSSASATEVPLVAKDGTATWTVPLVVRVGLSQVPTTLSAPLSAADLAGTGAPAIAQDELGEVEARIENFRDRPYYDEDADFAAYQAYFSDLPGTAQKPAEWFRYLSSKVSSTHSTVLSYRSARLDFLYPWVDLHEEDSARQLRNIYSGETLDVREAMLVDLESERRLIEAQREMLAESGISHESVQERLDLLESQLPFNCEHVVPQSWFFKAQPMRADLHHLFACDPGCNSFRSNIPYFDFDDFEEAIRERCGKRDERKFEPAAGKGPAARATLYFLLRYPGVVGDESRELQRNRLDVLLSWHENDPVGPYELHRNWAIHEVQGNRNPLIDHPELAHHIDFGRGFGLSQ